MLSPKHLPMILPLLGIIYEQRSAVMQRQWELCPRSDAHGKLARLHCEVAQRGVKSRAKRFFSKNKIYNDSFFREESWRYMYNISES